MLYRPYSLEDFDRIYAIEERCFEPPFRFDRGFMRQLINRKNAAAWIAEEDGCPQGFAIVHWSKPSQGTPSDNSSSLESEDKLAAYIETIEVTPEARAQGAGRQLLDHVEDSARQAGSVLIWLHVEAENEAAIRLYQTQGYSCKGRQDDYYPLGHAALIYVKRLKSR